MDWLEDEHVTRLPGCDSRHRFPSFIEASRPGRVQLPSLTHLFNPGRPLTNTFMAWHDQRDVPVGFVRLVKMGRDCGWVLVIGNHENWGRKLGASHAIREA